MGGMYAIIKEDALLRGVSVVHPDGTCDDYQFSGEVHVEVQDGALVVNGKTLPSKDDDLLLFKLGYIDGNDIIAPQSHVLEEVADILVRTVCVLNYRRIYFSHETGKVAPEVVREIDEEFKREDEET